MNPVMEQFFGGRRPTLTERQQFGYQPLPQDTDVFVRYLHFDMWNCFLNGHDHPAIVTACALLEFALKDVAYFGHFLDANKEFAKDQWNRIDVMTFEEIVNYARNRVCITKHDAKRYVAFKNDVRNPWMHGGTPPQLKYVTSSDVIQANFKTGEVKKVPLDVSDNPQFHGMARMFLDRDMAPRVVQFVDKEVRKLYEMTQRKHNNWSQQHGDAAPTREEIQRVLDNIKQKFGEDELSKYSAILCRPDSPATGDTATSDASEENARPDSRIVRE